MPRLFRVTTLMCGLLALGVFFAIGTRPAQARPQYMGWWSEAYPDVAKKHNAVKNCNVCHVDKKPKKMRNDYGQAIQKALDGKKNLKKTDENKEIFDETLKKVAKVKSGTPDKTFGDLLEAGDLPASK